MYNVGILNLTLAGIMGNLQQNCCWREKPPPTEAWPRQDKKLLSETSGEQPARFDWSSIFWWLLNFNERLVAGTRAAANALRVLVCQFRHWGCMHVGARAHEAQIEGFLLNLLKTTNFDGHGSNFHLRLIPTPTQQYTTSRATHMSTRQTPKSWRPKMFTSWLGWFSARFPLHVSCSSPLGLIAHSESRQILRHFPYNTALFGLVISWPLFTSSHDFPSGRFLFLETGVFSFKFFARYGAHMEGSPEWCLVLQNDPISQIQGGPLPALSRVINPFVWVKIRVPGTNL